MQNKKTVLIKFGGSVMVPDLPDVDYIKRFKKFIENNKNSHRFILVTGGGGINKKYNTLAKEVTRIDNQNLDWIGIYTTRLNARFLISIFGKDCHGKVVTDPTAKINWQENLIIGAGWKPGWSTDYCSMLLADNLKAEQIIIATNTDYIFDKDPNEFDDARELVKISWQELHAMVGDDWLPRMHIPLDPSAIRFGKEKKMRAISLNGRNLENLEKAIKGQKYIGTKIG
ncbi:MAG: UMP kinase [Candidatus Moranbacteria bacterium]|nr:UMP kinase [Candidatus Moranbacteria bacterium]